MIRNTELTLARQTAQQAGDLLADIFLTGKTTANMKDDQTLVTAADGEADRFIQRALNSAFPDHAVLSEEGQTLYPADAQFVWVVDPLDGTTNFSTGLHHWGVSIALLEGGFPTLSAVYFPLLREMYTASQNQGSYLNARQLNIREQVDPHSFFVHCSRTPKKYQLNLPYKTRSLGSAVFHLCSIAKGSSRIALETTVKLWDIAGAWLIIEEAGGLIQAAAETPPFPPQKDFDYNKINYTVLAAGDSRHLKLLLEEMDSNQP